MKLKDMAIGLSIAAVVIGFVFEGTSLRTAGKLDRFLDSMCRSNEAHCSLSRCFGKDVKEPLACQMDCQNELKDCLKQWGVE